MRRGRSRPRLLARATASSAIMRVRARSTLREYAHRRGRWWGWGRWWWRYCESRSVAAPHICVTEGTTRHAAWAGRQRWRIARYGCFVTRVYRCLRRRRKRRVASADAARIGLDVGEPSAVAETRPVDTFRIRGVELGSADRKDRVRCVDLKVWGTSGRGMPHD